ncbi:MAG: hypothetical protein HUJ13_05305, partial [Hydrogenovibrio crunogenus]|nr:hypothetical protein [Hydrogenovibrio crunogenus]
MKLFKILFNLFKLACVIALLPITLFTGGEVSSLFFGNDAEGNVNKVHKTRASAEKAQAKDLKRKLEVFELYNHPTKAQNEFLNQI